MNKFFAMLLSLACVTALVACDDDSDYPGKIELPAPQGLLNTLSDDESIDFVWNAVPNATQYGYRLYSPDDVVVTAGVTQDTSISIDGLQASTTYTLKVWAFAGLDTDYINSQATELSATTDVYSNISWTANGTYYSYMYKDSWDATLTAYKDGTYSIEAFYGIDGYNLDFTIDTDGNPIIKTGYLLNDGGYKYWLIPTGIDDGYGDMYYIYAYVWDGYVTFEGDSTGGILDIGNCGYSPYGEWYSDTFTW